MTAPLWTPTDAVSSRTQLALFKQHIAETYKLPLETYDDLHTWSIENLADFWAEVWRWPSLGKGGARSEGVVASKQWDEVLDVNVPMPDIPSWFKGAELNWAENMLLAADTQPDKVALIECCEPVPGEKLAYRRTTYGELKSKAHAVSLALSSLGLKKGQVLGYYGPNSSVAVILLLAATSLGAIWSSSASDFGPQGVLQRFSQFEDSLWGVVGVESVRYNGKVLDQRGKLKEVVAGLGPGKQVFIFDYLGAGAQPEEGIRSFDELLDIGEELQKTSGKMEFAQVPFDHPLWVLFSSGTTGKPKPIVHRAGGMLLQSKKEHILHSNMGPSDVFYYYTTTGWMMFNYLVAGLGVGASLVLFDGSPLKEPEMLWGMAEELGVTIFGTSAKYIDVLSTSYQPNKHHKLDALKQVQSTGSPLKAELFEWVYENIKKDIILSSITGGTDICSLFGAPNPLVPVFAGEVQCLGLGMAVASFSPEGDPLSRGEAGELVCTKAFPCMPLEFWGDVGRKRYHEAYFERFQDLPTNIWAHGDYCLITENGGLEMRGRSDGILNPSGIRFGSSEIYDILDTFAPSPIADSLVVAQKTQGGADERVVLFLQMAKGHEMTEDIVKQVKTKIRTMRSPRHVPERILSIADIPYTINGKKVEVPIKKILGGAPLTSINPATLKNAECLEEYVEIGLILRREVEA